MTRPRPRIRSALALGLVWLGALVAPLFFASKATASETGAVLTLVYTANSFGQVDPCPT